MAADKARPPRGHRRYLQQRRGPQVPEGHLVVGRILRPHGLRGEVKVQLYTDFPDRFAPGQSLLLGPDLEPVTVAASRPHQGQVLVRFHGVEDRTEAEALRGEWLYIPEEAAQELEEDTYYIHQLLGLEVRTEEGRVLGELVDVIVTGANDVYVVRPAPGINRGREILVPAIAQVVQSVDIQGRVLTVRLMPGLLEEETQEPG